MWSEGGGDMANGRGGESAARGEGKRLKRRCLTDGAAIMED